MTAPDLDQLKRELKVAQVRQALAEAEQKAAEATKATEEAERARAAAGETARRDELKADAELRKTVAESDAAAIKALLEPAIKALLEPAGVRTAGSRC